MLRPRLRPLVPAVADAAGRARKVPGAHILGAGAATGVLALAIVLPVRAGAAQGDPVYPQAGTASYDVRHYAITLSYDPEENRLLEGTRTTIRARAKERLPRVKLDFRGLDVTAVKVDGRPASFAMRDARPRLGGGPRVSQPGKLIADPARAIKRGARFRVSVSYEGRPRAMLGPDGAPQGWIRACHGDECDGSFTVNEPIGAQSWFPCNDRPGDKATIATEVTVPDGYTAIGTGELTGASAGPGGRTWSWREDEPVATYLASATVGRFLLDEDSIGDGRGGRLPVLVAIDAAASPGAVAAVRRSAGHIPALMRFLRARLGRYPFGSTGLVADWVPRVGYALENQTLPHFGGDREGPGVSTALLAHELAHQWMGNAVTPRNWSQVWFSEGWATWLERRWAANNDLGTGPGELLREVLAMPRSAWRIAPADRRRSPALLFTSFATYERPAAMLEGYRRIAGTKALWRLARRLSRERRYRNIGEKRFVREALNSAGARGGHRRKLRRYFRQWLHRRARPTLTPAAFRRR